jgi:hypothetical protein
MEKIMKPYLKCKYAECREISPKAAVVKCYDGSEDILPLSQIRFAATSHGA